MGTPLPIAGRERQGRTEMDARLHCSETRAIVEAKCKTIRFDSQRRRCVNMATVQRGCRRRRGDKCEVVAMMKEHMQPRGGRSRHWNAARQAVKNCMMLGLDGGLMERLSLCRHSQCRVYNAMQCLPCLLWTAVKSAIAGRPWDERLGPPDRSTSSRLLRAGAGLHFTT